MMTPSPLTLSYKKVLVTGGAGFIGSHLVKALLARGADVSVIDNLTTGHEENLASVRKNIRFEKNDIREAETLNTLAQGCEVIFHQAAIVSVPHTVHDPIESSMVNEIGTLRVLEAARLNGVKRVVIASSCAVYGDLPELPKTEKMPVKPLSPYAVQKLTGEYYAKLYSELYGLQTVSLRYFNVYGANQDPTSPYSGVISIFMKKAIEKSRPHIYDDGNQYRDFIYVKDVVRANLLASLSERADGAIYNIGTGKMITVNELWKLIQSFAKFDLAPEYHPPRKGDIRESRADIALAHNELSFEPLYPFEQGLHETFEWYRDALLVKTL